MRGALDCLLDPNAVAVIGASSNPGKIGNVLVGNLLSGKRAKIFPVNPNEKSIGGLRCYPSIDDLPHEIDLAIVAIPARRAMDETRRLVERGVPCVIVVSAGFSEAGENGREMERSMVLHARAAGTRILGPNTIGVYSPISGLDALLVSRDRSPRPSIGRLGIISQSGSVLVSLLEKCNMMGIGCSYCVGLGNRADISEIDLLRHMQSSEETGCIALYIESFADGKGFLETAREICREKPIVTIKAGRTSAGTRAAKGHTGAIAEETDALVDAALRQAGVVRAYDDEELLDLAAALAMMSHAEGGRIAYVGSAGGIGVMAADYIEGQESSSGIRMAMLDGETQDRLRRSLGELAPVGNPVDLTASATVESYDAAMQAVMEDPNVDLVIVSLDLQPPMIDDGVFSLLPTWKRMGMPIVGTSTGGATGQRALKRMWDAGIPSYPSLLRCVRAARALCERGRFLRKCGAGSASLRRSRR